MVKTNAYRFAFAFAFVASPSVASEFGDACLAAEIFTQKNCACIDSKASADDKARMMAALTAEKVQASGGQVDEQAATRGLEILGRYSEQCDKQ